MVQRSSFIRLMKRRAFLMGLGTVMVLGRHAFADSKELSVAFDKLVTVIRKNPEWWLKGDGKTRNTIHDLAVQTGFDALLENTLIKFNDKNVAIKIVHIERNRIVYSHDGDPTETIFTTVEEAIAEIYGVSKL